MDYPPRGLQRLRVILSTVCYPDLIMKKLTIFFSLLAIAMTALADDQIKVFHPAKTRAGLLRADTIAVEAAYNKIGLHDWNMTFHPDSISPLGYAEVEYGRSKSWGVIDTDGNFLFNEFSKTPYTSLGRFLLRKEEDGTSKIFDLSGQEVLHGVDIRLLRKKDKGGLYGIWAVVDSVSPKTILFDAGLDTLMCIPGDYRPKFQGYDYMTLAQKLSGPDSATFILVNAKGQIGMKTPITAYPYRLEDYANKKQLAELARLYGSALPPLLLNKNTDQYNYVYFLDRMVYDKAPRVETFEKSIKKAWNDIYPIISDPKFAEYYKQQYVLPAQEVIAANQKITSYAPEPVHASKMEIVEKKGKKFFLHNGKPLKYNPNGYDDVEPVEGTNVYIAYRDTLSWLVNQAGVRFTNACQSIEPIDILDKYKAPVLMVREKGKTSVRTSSGLRHTESYDEILPVRDDSLKIVGFYFMNDNKWAYGPLSKLKSPTFYDYITPFDTAGMASVYYDGQEGRINTKGKKVRDVCGKLYRSARSKDKTPAERIAIYKYITDIASKVDEGEYLVPSYRSMASLYEKAGFVNEAINAYEWAEICGDEASGKDVRRLKTDKVINALQAVASTLNNMAAALGGNPSDYNFSSSASSSGGSSSFAASGASLQGQYRNWERRAQSIYESLTNSGYRVKKNGKDTAGGSAGSRAPSSFLAQKRLLREAQHEMEKIRRKDPSIPRSQYESVTVDF